VELRDAAGKLRLIARGFRKYHVDVYDRDPRDKDHKSIHVNWDSNTGKGNIVDTTKGSKERTDIGCYLTTACMKHFKENFDDKCYELEVLRWFRDNFVSKEDIKHYYEVAPQIVLAISQCGNEDMVYDYIYDNIVDCCVNAIENGDYEFAYSRYKSSVLSLEESFVKPLIQEDLVKTLKKTLI